MNMFDRFQTGPLGFDDFNAWMRHYEKLHAQFPLGCTKVGEEWLALWEALGKLLRMRARVKVYAEKSRRWVPMCGIASPRSLGDCLAKACLMRGHKYARRVAILDRTIIKEWGPR